MPVYLAVVMMLLAACREEASTGADATVSPPSSTCEGDDDCVFASRCCGGCGDMTAPFDVVTRAEANAARLLCDPNRSCPTYDCSSPPPCLTSVRSACIAGRCGVRSESVELHDVGVGPCNCDGCGAPPDLNDGPCGGYRQIMYERCCCLHSGVPSCAPDRWSGFITACKVRDQCAPDAATLAQLPDLDGCRVTTAHEVTPGDFAKRWVAATRGEPTGARVIIWEQKHGIGFIRVETGERSSLGISGGGAPTSPDPFATADGRTLILSGWRTVAFARPDGIGSVDVVRTLGIEGLGEVRGVTPDLATLLIYEGGVVPARWSLNRYDSGSAVFTGWSHRVTAAPAFLFGSLAPDGREAIVELACAPTPCNSTFARFDGETGAATPVPIPDARAPRWLANDRLLFEVPGTAPGTQRLVTASRGDLAKTTVWREGAWSPAVTPVGLAEGRVAYLIESDACRAAREAGAAPFRCRAAKLETAALDGSDARVIASDVSDAPAEAWSPDGAWIAFNVPVDATKSQLRVCRADGSACRDLGDMWLRGWLL